MASVSRAIKRRVEVQSGARAPNKNGVRRKQKNQEKALLKRENARLVLDGLLRISGHLPAVLPIRWAVWSGRKGR